MANVHLFSDVRRREIHNNFLFWNLWEVKTLDKFINFRLYQSILNSDLEETFFISFDGTDNVILEVVIHNFLGKL